MAIPCHLDGDGRKGGKRGGRREARAGAAMKERVILMHEGRTW